MKILILGGSGLVGSHVVREALTRGHEVVGTTRSHELEGFITLELGDAESTMRLLDDVSPDVVVYAAGWTWVDGCEKEPERSRRENFVQPLAVARWCAQRKAKMVYYSTSYVFDGVVGNYVETDAVSPINVYGRHKADAEAAILDATAGAALVPRLICVWGLELARKNFVYQVIRAAREGRRLVLPSDQSGNPTWAGDIAAWTLVLLEATQTGIWHLAGPDPEMTRSVWAQHVADGLARSGRTSRLEVELRPTAELTQVAPRPLRAGMRCDKVHAFAPLVCRNAWQLPEGL